jgi:hypothetical protein
LLPQDRPRKVRWTPDRDLADLAIGHILAIGVDHPDIDTVQGFAQRAPGVPLKVTTLA